MRKISYGTHATQCTHSSHSLYVIFLLFHLGVSLVQVTNMEQWQSSKIPHDARTAPTVRPLNELFARTTVPWSTN